MSLAGGLGLEALVIMGIITQSNANIWLIAAGILLIIGIYFILAGTILRPKAPPLDTSNINSNQIQITKWSVQNPNLILRFIIVCVALFILAWGIITNTNVSSSFLIGIILLVYGFAFTR